MRFAHVINNFLDSTKMRKRFEEQFEIGLKPIAETRIFIKSRDDFPAIAAALIEIFKNNKAVVYNKCDSCKLSNLPVCSNS